MKPKLTKSLFWDVEYESIDFQKNSRFVIERVLTRGNFQDWRTIRDFYGLDKIAEEVVQVRYLDKLTFNFCQKFFNIEKEKFRCYNTEPSIRQLWNY